jgi:electron transfer flavoprotein beta subunit
MRARVTLPAMISVDLRIIGTHAVKNGVTPDDHEYPAENVRYTPLPMINKAKKKPLEEKALADLGVDTTTRVAYLGFVPPPERKAGIKVETVDELVDKLKNEARAL